MHELIEDASLSGIIRELKPEHKELLFYLMSKQLSTVQIGAIRGQSDRNIRKVWKTVEKKIRKAVNTDEQYICTYKCVMDSI